MPHTEDLVFKSKAQAEKLRQVFVDRYGESDGLKRFKEIEKRSPKLEDLPDKVVTGFHHPKKAANPSRKFGGRWRGI